MREGVRIFAAADVVLRDASADTGARNERRLAAVYTGPTAGFEVSSSKNEGERVWETRGRVRGFLRCSQLLLF